MPPAKNCGEAIFIQAAGGAVFAEAPSDSRNSKNYFCCFCCQAVFIRLTKPPDSTKLAGCLLQGAGAAFFYRPP
jgi:hypothetical protein